jgi:hypothetical protein
MLNELLLIIVFLTGGAFIIYVYEAYRNTRARSLLLLSFGFFLMLIGANLDAVFAILRETALTPISFLIEIVGILVILYAALKV